MKEMASFSITSRRFMSIRETKTGKVSKKVKEPMFAHTAISKQREGKTLKK
jgi:hypothetical protein